MANYQFRFLARVIIEAKAPFNIGSGNKGVKSDSLVLRDVNGLPFIPGTTLAGLLRHSLNTAEEKEAFFGSQKYGSSLIISEARMLDEDGTVLDGIVSQDRLNTHLLSYYKQLPIRQHAKIGHRGSTVKGGKFDEEIILKGTRFCFEIEMLSENSDDARFKTLLNTLKSHTFRIGSGSRSGFGEIDVIKCLYKNVNLTVKEQKEWYLEKSSSLAEAWEKPFEELELKEPERTGWTTYRLRLKPVDFLLFGAGFGNDSADMTYVRESFVDWREGVANVVNREKVLLIPASSVKGALSHRLAFHYNCLSEKFVNTLNEIEKTDDFVGKNNDAVKAVFGSEGEKDEKGKMKNKQRGNALVSDVIEQTDTCPKVLNHVSIDRFTGGAIDGALFNEEVLYARDLPVSLEILVNNEAFKTSKIQEALEKALIDLCSGLLPLGGGTNRGNGCFEGILTRNGEQIYGTN